MSLGANTPNDWKEPPWFVLWIIVAVVLVAFALIRSGITESQNGSDSHRPPVLPAKGHSRPTG